MNDTSNHTDGTASRQSSRCVVRELIEKHDWGGF